MNLSKKERLLLVNQYKILSSLEKNNSSHYNELIEILENGYSIFYSMVDEWMSEDMPTEEGKFVLDILDFYRAVDNLKRTTKNKTLEDHPLSFFRGFDGNNEGEYMSFARFLLQKQGKFSEQEQYLRRNDNMNSHMPMAPRYREILEKAKSVDIWNMSVNEALSILDV